MYVIGCVDQDNEGNDVPVDTVATAAMSASAAVTRSISLVAVLLLSLVAPFM